MPSVHNKRFRTLFILSISIAGIFLLLIESNQMGFAFNRNSSRIEKCSGIDVILKQMNHELSNTRKILSAQPKQIVFMDADNNINRYTYRYNTLWRNGNPVATNISSFNFEYRNSVGNLFITAQRYLSQVTTVAYVVHIAEGKEDIFTNSRVVLASIK